MKFLRYEGGELIVEIARLMASLADHDPERDRYVIQGVVGPDEYHEAYPDSERPGIDNNAYTNVMTAWVMRCGARPHRGAAAGCKPFSSRAPGRRGRGADAVGDHEPPDVRALPWQRTDRPVRRLRRAARIRLGRLTGRSTATSSASIASSRPKATAPTATSSPSRPTC